MKKDLESLEDIKLLVDTFYGKVQQNKVIGYIFSDVAHVNWQHHLPIMYNFWDSVIFGSATYKGNPMSKHIALNQKETLTETHFAEWLRLWKLTVDELFEGHKAEEIKERATDIQSLMLFKVQQKTI